MSLVYSENLVYIPIDNLKLKHFSLLCLKLCSGTGVLNPTPDLFLARFKMADRKMLLAGFLIILSVFSGVQCGGKTLVLVDNWAIRETHSIFFRSLRGVYFV